VAARDQGLAGAGVVEALADQAGVEAEVLAAVQVGLQAVVQVGLQAVVQVGLQAVMQAEEVGAVAKVAEEETADRVAAAGNHTLPLWRAFISISKPPGSLWRHRHRMARS
jgi:hypothetical protein